MPQAFVRISSASRTSGDRSNFSVILTTAVRRAVGFVPIHMQVFNNWPNISAARGNNTFEVTYSVGPTTTLLTIPDGMWYTSATSPTFDQEVQTLLDTAVGGAGRYSITYSQPTNKLSVTRQAAAAGTTLQFNYANTTARRPLGLTADLLINTANATPFQQQVDLTDYATISVGSSQLRMPVSIDTRRDGAKNAFLNVPNTAGKGSYLTYTNAAPTALSVVRLPGPTDFSYISLELFDPETGTDIPLTVDWEILVLFLLAPIEP